MSEYRGFIEPVIDSSNHFLGGSTGPLFPVVHESGDWGALLPEGELQNKRGIETYDCTGFNTLNAIEILMYRKFGIRVNYSDRWLGIVAGTNPANGGNDPHTVAEAIRKYGLIPEEMLPFSDDIKDASEYYSFKGADEAACRAAGKKWLEDWDFYHKWVFDENQPIDEKLHNIAVALKSSPLGIAVYAWHTDENGYYISNGRPNHWTTEYGLSTVLEFVFDSYEPFKKIAKQNIFFAKVYHIEKKIFPTESAPDSWFQKLLNFLKNATSTNAVFTETPIVQPNTVPSTIPSTPKPIPPPPQKPPQLLWDTKANVRHSIRVICDEEGVSYKRNILINGKYVSQKDIICAVIEAESGFNTKAEHKNADARKTTDYGLCQFNSYWYIGKGKPIASIDEALNNPEKCVRVMIAQYKKGRLSDWYAFRNGNYKQFL